MRPGVRSGSTRPRPPARGWWLHAAGLLAAWLACTAVVALLLFLSSSRPVVLATHDAVVQPELGGTTVVHTGPVLPDVRVDSGGPIGVDVQLGKTDAGSLGELVQRYALIAGHPQGLVAKVKEAVGDMLVAALLRGAVLGAVPVAVWLLVGRRRRRELVAAVGARLGPRSAVAGVVVLVAVGLALLQPWAVEDEPVTGAGWQPLGDLLGPEVPLPPALRGVQVRGDVTTASTRRLVTSALHTFDKSKTFYARAVADAAELPLREPQEGDTVVLFVSDRHDNIGMDEVARAIGDRGGATAVFDGGDDTSTGSTWEAFSLDSITAATDGLDRWGVAGNHDHGPFVHSYLADRGWTMLEGRVVDGPGGTALLGVDDPRSSGLGDWRDETGLSFDEVADRLADEACSSDRRVTTLLVHDANLGAPALRRGCVDLVLGGHTHVRRGPDPVAGPDGQVGHTYTTGTAGGAAYAIALGSKPRRPAVVTLVTYRDGRPWGVQWVTLQTDGRFQTGNWVPMHVG